MEHQKQTISNKDEITKEHQKQTRSIKDEITKMVASMKEEFRRMRQGKTSELIYTSDGNHWSLSEVELPLPEEHKP